MPGLLQRLRGFVSSTPPDDRWIQTVDKWARKKWRRGSEVVEVDALSGSGAQAVRYYRSEEPRRNQVLTNGLHTVPEAVWVAKLYMNHEIILPACPLRVDTEGPGLRFKPVPTRIIRDYVENAEEDTPTAVKEFLKHAHEGDILNDPYDRRNPYYREDND